MKRVFSEVKIDFTSNDIRLLWQLIGKWRLWRDGCKTPLSRDEVQMQTIRKAKQVESYILDLINEAYRMGKEDANGKGN